MNLPPQKDIESFYLSLFSNLVANKHYANPDRQLYQAILEKMADCQPRIGQWEIVWGPVVKQLIKKGDAANAMYVAHNLNEPSRYVVAIAASNPGSMFDWLVEDSLVKWQIPWIFGKAPARARISLGTAIGLFILLMAKVGNTLPGAGKSLKQFLKSLPDKKIDLCFAGHSLGGILSPTLALYFLDRQSSWDPGRNAKISARPTAGPTAGNLYFARYSDQVLTDITRYWNRLDAVPHLWNPASIEQIKGIYKPYIPKESPIDFGINLLVEWLKGLGAKGKYFQINPKAASFPGEINSKIIDPDKSNFENFIRQVNYQHFDSYQKYFGYSDGFLSQSHQEPKEIITPAWRRIIKKAEISFPS
ncbi:MAG TPA: hypothetical protein VHY08_10875 [Bacillota bacterium]|nr:hypothetical protein [Bacillota bacterium]